jgi:hypothetical protein
VVGPVLEDEAEVTGGGVLRDQRRVRVTLVEVKKDGGGIRDGLLAAVDNVERFLAGKPGNLVVSPIR